MYVPVDPTQRYPTRRRQLIRFTHRVVRKVVASSALHLLPDGDAAADAVRKSLTLPDQDVTAGRWTYFDGAPFIHRYPGAEAERIELGSFTSVANDVVFFLGGNHDLARVTTSPIRKWLGVEEFDTSGEMSGKGGIRIGNDVWVGRRAILLSGANVGDGAVIGAGAVVAGSVAPYAIVVGNPAREVRRRFSPDIVARLQASRWWDLPDERIKELVDLLSSRDIEAFLHAVESSAGAASPIVGRAPAS